MVERGMVGGKEREMVDGEECGWWMERRVA